MAEKDKGTETDKMFESMEYFSNQALKDMMETIEEQQKEIGKWLGVTTDFGTGVKDVLEETNHDVEKLMEIWTEFEHMAEDIAGTEEEIIRPLTQDFVEYNRKVNEKLGKMVEESFENSRQLYSSWSSILESYFNGLKAGTGPNYDELMDSVADFQQTAAHVALRDVDDVNEEMKELRETLDEFAQNTEKRFNEAVESGNKKYQEYIKAWQEKIEDMNVKVNDYMKNIEKGYVSSMEPYFKRRFVMPFFPWLPRTRMNEYETEMEELKERLETMEKKLEEKE